MADAIKSMELYPRPERVLVELRARGFADHEPVPVETVAEFDQLHYHGTTALDLAIERAAIDADSRVLEIGSGWGGCARWIAHRTGAEVTAVEMQSDYDTIARSLTDRTGLNERVTHVNADFLHLDVEPGSFSHVVSWLALFHIPDRPRYLAVIAAALRPDGALFVEDLHAGAPVPDGEQADFTARLFPNSLVPLDVYVSTVEAAGLSVTAVEDMGADWTAFTTERRDAFRATQADFEQRHDAVTFASLDRFYDGMASDFARGHVGGLRLHATRP